MYLVRSPSTAIYLLMMLVCVQLVVWLVGRDSLDTEWWRSATLAAVSIVITSFVAIFGFYEGILGYCAAAGLLALLVWILSGLLYEPEMRQRIIISLSVPALAIALDRPAQYLGDKFVQEILNLAT